MGFAVLLWRAALTSERPLLRARPWHTWPCDARYRLRSSLVAKLHTESSVRLWPVGGVGWGKGGFMTVKKAGERVPRTPFLKVGRVLIISVLMIMAVAISARSVIVAKPPVIIATG